MHHQFIFSPGIWLGVGRLSTTAVPMQATFYLRWNIFQIQEGIIHCQQLVETEGGNDPILNRYQISAISSQKFEISLNSNLSGIAKGKGNFDQEKIEWEFTERTPYEDLEGFAGKEAYFLQENGEYHFHCEFYPSLKDQTLVHGRIWKKIDS